MDSNEEDVLIHISDSDVTQDFRNDYSRVQCCSAVPYVFFLFVFGYVSFVHQVVYRWKGLSWEGAIHFSVISFLIISLTYNYFKSVLSTPGIVPDDWKPKSVRTVAITLQNPEDNKRPTTHDDTSSRLDAEEDEQVSFCGKCSSLRPPRAHHCSECGHCILKYDHHCPWINNCVGYFNHKYFMLFLTYLILTGVYMLIFLIWRLIYGIQHADLYKLTSVDFDGLDLAITVTQLVIDASTVMCVSFLCVYQSSLIADNTTNLEHMEISRKSRKIKKKCKSIYDKGRIENFKEVLGNKKRMWMWPSLPVGDGFSFKIAKRSEA